MIDVIAKLEKSARARLSWIQSFAASFGIVPRPIYGHITLAELGSREEIAACKESLGAQEAFTVDVQKIDVLAADQTVVALAAPEGGLAEVRRKLVPGEGNWTPAIVLLRDNMVDLNWVCKAMAQMFQPFAAKVERIEFVESNEVIDGMDLKGETA